MMSRVKRARTTVLLAPMALTASLALAGCGGTGMSEGVVIDGTGYSVEEVQEAAQQLTQVSTEQIDVQGAIYEAGVVPVLDQIFAGSPYEATESDIRSTLAEAGLEEEASDLTVEAGRFRYYGQLINSEAAGAEDMQPILGALQAVTVEDIDALPVEVNPRFGTWDGANGGVVPEVPAWIQSSDG